MSTIAPHARPVIDPGGAHRHAGESAVGVRALEGTTRPSSLAPPRRPRSRRTAGRRTRRRREGHARRYGCGRRPSASLAGRQNRVEQRDLCHRRTPSSGGDDRRTCYESCLVPPTRFGPRYHFESKSRRGRCIRWLIRCAARGMLRVFRFQSPSATPASHRSSPSSPSRSKCCGRQTFDAVTAVGDRGPLGLRSCRRPHPP